METAVNGFELHGIKSSSASQVNLWANCPALWIAEKLYGFRGKMSAAAHRGTMIEKAVVDIIAHGRTETDAVADALTAFHRSTALGSERDKAEADMIPHAVKLALVELAPYGEPQFNAVGAQNKIELICKGDGWILPIIGYTDLPFPKHGITVDLKTTQRIPSEMSPEHRRQRAIYKRALGNQRVAFLYVSGKRASWLEPDSETQDLADVKNILNRQERFLRLGDKEMLSSIVHHDPESFYWNGAAEAAKQIFK